MLKTFLRGLREATPETPGVNRELATAVLLLEVARSDYKDRPEEMDSVRAALSAEFGMDEATLDGLVADAQKESQSAVSMFDYVKTLNQTLSAQDKRDLLRRLWEVAFADGQIEAIEEHTLRKLADLLHVPHQDFIRGKLSAAKPAGGAR